MKVQAQIEEKLQQHLQPSYLQVVNESHMHSGPATESHFKLIVVSELFSTLSAVKRHQEIYRLLQDQLNKGVHALALHTYSDQEWQLAKGRSPESPDCLGGSK